VWSTADLVVLVPMRGRSHRVEPLLASIADATPEAAVLFLVTPEDVDVRDAVGHAGARSVLVPWRPAGDYARKINEGIRHTAEPLIFTGADDLRFHPGWFETATAKLTEGVGVVGTNDLCNRRTIRGEHSTHSLVTRDYTFLGQIDGAAGLLHEGYVHEYCDDEMVGTAKHRRAYAHAHDAVVEHLHPMAGHPTDPQYDQQAARMAASRDLYRRRRRLWM
jgi:hypothetical protein